MPKLTVISTVVTVGVGVGATVGVGVGATVGVGVGATVGVGVGESTQDINKIPSHVDPAQQVAV